MQKAWAGSPCVIWFAQAGLFSSTVTEILPLHILWEAQLESQCWAQEWGDCYSSFWTPPGGDKLIK